MLQFASSRALAQALGQAFFDLRRVDAPDGPVAVVGVGILRGEMRRHQRGIRPVQQARGQAVVLRHGQKLPKARVLGEVGVAVFAETADDRLFKAEIVRADAVERGHEPPVLVRRAAIDAVGAVAHDLFIPHIVKDGPLQVVPILDDDFQHRCLRDFRLTLNTFDTGFVKILPFFDRGKIFFFVPCNHGKRLL